jgi:2-polyprenyl-3-methyl-5-hydroxy-6-metoxy-1,4-benzoquinol methylase
MMKQPIVENGIVVGTGSDKFEQKNPLVRWALRGFDETITELIGNTNPDHILEVGCGEGHVTRLLLEHTNASVQAMDISEQILDIARREVNSDRVTFKIKNILELDSQKECAALVVCCEVLEHLEDPTEGLRRLAETANPFAILSVPREPIFRALNFLRGAHVRALGNSPGHLQHWSTRGFLRFIEEEFDILEVRTPLPWTAVLARSRKAPKL